MWSIVHAFMEGFHAAPPCCSRQECIHHDKEMRDGLSEKQIDRMVEASFPASDPPSTY